MSGAMENPVLRVGPTEAAVTVTLRFQLPADRHVTAADLLPLTEERAQALTAFLRPTVLARARARQRTKRPA